MNPHSDTVAGRRTIVVEGMLALRMRRAQAARNSELGLDILTLPALAARLAGGFSRLADHAVLVPMVALALSEITFEELEGVKARPGMARAVLSSLGRVWNAGLRLDDPDISGPRLDDLRRVETYLRDRLPAGTLLLPDLRDEAMANANRAGAVLGPVHLHRIVSVEPLWRPLLDAAGAHTEITWEAPGAVPREWFGGSILQSPSQSPELLECDVCADPRAEIVEALRWARTLLSDGVTRAGDVAIGSADLTAWDEHMLVLAADADLPVHFASGVPALSTHAGQACAALADVMINGLSQDRVRRLSLLSPYLSEALPADWMKAIPSEAGLFEPSHWALSLEGKSGDDGAPIASVLMPVIEKLKLGVAAAAELGGLLLSGRSLRLWQQALRLAPAAAVEMTLASLRISDERDPAGSIVWARADDLVGAPRRHMRLLGLSSRSWPRADAEDPLLPDHVIRRQVLVDLPRIDRDRLAFETLTTFPGAGVVLSRSRRSAEGSFLAKSALVQQGVTEHVRARTRVPAHAFSEGDRLLARTADALTLPRVRSLVTCWTNWSRRPEITRNDGGYRQDHPAVIRALSEPQSATSLRRLLRDPLGYVWVRVLGMSAPELAVEPLQLDAVTFGELVHELLRLAVDQLEPDPGLVGATASQIDAALDKSAQTIAGAWPLARAVPPRLLWLDTIAEARRRARRGLTLDERFGPGTRSFSEVPFGETGPDAALTAPWRSNEAVTIGSRSMRLRGRVDRIDVKADRRGARISDYKTGNTPRDHGDIVLGGGSEVQRALYALVARQLIPEVTTVISRPVYLDTMEAPATLEGDALDGAVSALERFADLAAEQVRSGDAHPGPDAFARYNDLRIALPASLDAYRNRKDEAFSFAHHRLAPLWVAR